MGERADIAFQIGRQIGVVEGNEVDFRVGLQLRKSPAHDGGLRAGLRQGGANFRQRQRFQFDNVDAAGERFGDALHQSEFLRTGQEVLPVPSAVRIHRCLEVPE